MRFMILIKATKDTEAGVLPDQKLLAEMGKFNEELVLREKTQRDRRAFCRNQGIDLWFLDLASQLQGGSDRMGQALSQPA